MTQMQMFDPRLDRLYAMCRAGSKARYLGEWLLDHPEGVTTAELAEWGRNHHCSSCMERLRLDLRGRCRWRIEVRVLPDRTSRLYTVRPDATEVAA